MEIRRLMKVFQNNEAHKLKLDKKQMKELKRLEKEKSIEVLANYVYEQMQNLDEHQQV